MKKKEWISNGATISSTSKSRGRGISLIERIGRNAFVGNSVGFGNFLL
jgi:hypothetical protein